ncbi:hypothetical protein GMAR_ORF113 [Golden Marseillevirus]|uniref:hypothetical protein n=1 Tax=Golden Marseillevirus TaxID=1720526 RepID=UPI000877ACF2|nr:hypothetical protein GMAR_ORF113 [Golden Marseillevirus]ALX27487.1 hypothetical protein GMAR_ORF113 [Golden Marseillevirus]
MDWDNAIGFWLKGFPYIWVDNDEWEKCKRIYLVDPKTRAYARRGLSAGSVQWLRKTHEDEKNFLIRGCYDGVENYFLACEPIGKEMGIDWLLKREKGRKEVRIEGERLSPKKVKFEEPKEEFEFIPTEWGEKTPARRELRLLLEKQDKKSAQLKYSKLFGYYEIGLCIDTNFLYPITKNIPRWMGGTNVRNIKDQRQICIYARLEGRHDRFPDFKLWAQDKGLEKDSVFYPEKCNIFGFGELFASSEKQEQHRFTMTRKEVISDEWFLAGLVNGLSERRKRGECPHISSCLTLYFSHFVSETKWEKWGIAMAILKRKGMKKFSAELDERLESWMDRDFYPGTKSPKPLTREESKLLDFLLEEGEVAPPFVPNEIQLGDLPDEILFEIAKNSPGTNFSFVSTRFAGIWKEVQNLKRLIRARDKKSANMKYSTLFGEEEIGLCIDTDFMYPVGVNFYERWGEDPLHREVSKQIVALGRALGKRQRLPKTRTLRGRVGCIFG